MLLIAGAMVNVAVAWAIAAWWPPVGQPAVMTAARRADGDYAGVTRLSLLGRTRICYGTLRDVQWEADGRAANVDWRFESENFTELQVGWPLRTLSSRNMGLCSMTTARGTASLSTILSEPVVDGIGLAPFPMRGSAAFSWRALPYRPMWAGLIVNTLFYAVALGLLFVIPNALRRRLRRRRGQCEACGYPIGTSPVCTECGAAVPAA